MAQIAIKGHPTRGKEVIEILEMLGGKQPENYLGNGVCWCYTIIGGDIDWDYPSDKYKVFTLEQFLEEFPYKVGDKVLYHESKAYIKSMKWDGRGVVYTVECNKELWETTVFFLQLYKEEILEGVYAYNEINCYHQDFGDKVRIRLGNDFEIKVEEKITYIVKKQPQYPKTYEECCEVLKIEYPYFKTEEDGISASTYKNKLFGALKQLLVCRDAYWKIAGEWEPDWLDTNTQKYCIYYVGNEIKQQPMLEVHHFLAFPTKEMRDEFYENFKKLIEACKRLI